MSKEDPDVCEALRSLLADEGINILLNARIKQVSGKCGERLQTTAPGVWATGEVAGSPQFTHIASTISA